MTHTSLSFDQAVGYYDQTRHLPESMATRGLQLILDKAGTNGRILEVGAGTGRISVPLLQRGANLIGCDLSLEMMGKLRQKYSPARLAQASAEQLPFPSDQFDVALTVHVLHLVGQWHDALHEIRRVLKPGGIYINSWNQHQADAPSHRLRTCWREYVEAHGGRWRRPGVQTRDELFAAIQAMGGSSEEVEIEHAQSSWTPRQMMDYLAQRIYSETWLVSDEVLAISVAEAREWALHEWGDLDRTLTEEDRMVLDVITF
jgi:ubiquinone/menaquinone biosynthesis C-methylase UbiE